MNETSRYKKQICEIIKKFIPNCKIILFGSRARNTHQPGADIDIAILKKQVPPSTDTETPIDKKVLGLIEEEIEETSIPLFVDLIDLQNTSEELKEKIKKEGILWET